jgi:hypothetical protein
MRYELGFYIPEDRILHNLLRENLKSYKAVTTVLILQYPKLFYSSSTIAEVSLETLSIKDEVVFMCKHGAMP